MTEIAESTLIETEFLESLAYRERFDIPEAGGSAEPEAGAPMGLSAADVAAWTDEAVRRLVSSTAYQQTVVWETGGRDYYEKRLTMPTWPGAQSGVTIGVGFDLGYHSPAEIEAAWGDQVSRNVLDRLLRTAGTKAEAAKPLIAGIGDIRVPWFVAEAVFVRSTLPKYARLVLRHVANAPDLNPHAFGALFSLVFNRGPSFQRSGDRYAEMRAIALAMADRKPEAVPGHIRAMKRLWPSGLKGLLLRRDGEAELFDKGLDEARRPLIMAQLHSDLPAVPALQSTPVADTGRSLVGEMAEDWPVDGSLPELAAPLPESMKGKALRLSDVKWPDSDDDAPDYRHINDRHLAGKPYDITADDIELLIAANRYAPFRGNQRIVFGLRGARLAGDRMQIDLPSLAVTDTRPDHRNYRCVIGVLNLATRRLSGFVASTVPNAHAVLRGWELNAAGVRPWRGNMLTTGCYPYVVGAHGSKQVPGCLLQGTSAKAEDRASVIVLRSLKDVTYDLGDFWHRCTPHDNLHPGFLAEGFSSEGCQTIRGQFTNGAHSGDFAAFKEALGKPGTGGAGARFDYVLITSLEAAIAVDLRMNGLAGNRAIVDERLGCLRQGSRGTEAVALQRFLGQPETGEISARDRELLIERQIDAGLPPDGIFSPAMDRALSARVFDATSASVVVASSDSTVMARVALANGSAPRAESIEVALGKSEEELLAEIGRLSRDSGGKPMPEAFGLPVSLGEFGRAVFGDLEMQLHGLICGSSAADQGLRGQLATAIGLDPANANRQAAVAAIAAAIVTYLPVLPVLAVPVATLLLGRYLDRGLDFGCTRWSDALASRQALSTDVATATDTVSGTATEPANGEEAMMVNGRLKPAAYLLFASEMLPVEEIRKAKSQHFHVMVGFDSGNIPATGTIRERAFQVARELGAELAIYVEGPGGPTGNAWLPDESARVVAAARSVGIDTARHGWEKQQWQTTGWRSYTFGQLAAYKQQGFHAAEIDNLGWVLPTTEQLIAFYAEYAGRHTAGSLPQLVMKNLDPEAMEAVAVAVEAGKLPRSMFSEFHICETSCGYDTAKVGNISRRIAVRTILSRNTYKYDARGSYGYEAEFERVYATQNTPTSPAGVATISHPSGSSRG